MYLKLTDEHFLLACISCVSVYHLIIVHLLSSKVAGLDQKKARNLWWKVKQLTVNRKKNKFIKRIFLVSANRYDWFLVYEYISGLICLHRLKFTFYIQEAMDVFKSLLKSANVRSDWTWEQVIQLSLLAVLGACP